MPNKSTNRGKDKPDIDVPVCETILIATGRMEKLKPKPVKDAKAVTLDRLGGLMGWCCQDGGTVTTVAGGRKGPGGDGGAATEAGLDRPHGCAVDAQGNLWIADSENHRVRKVAAGN